MKLAMTLRSLPRAATSYADVVTDDAAPVERRQGHIQRLEAGDDGEGSDSTPPRSSPGATRFRARGIRRRRAASHRLASPVPGPRTSRRRRLRGARLRGGDAHPDGPSAGARRRRGGIARRSRRHVTAECVWLGSADDDDDTDGDSRERPPPSGSLGVDVETERARVIRGPARGVPSTGDRRRDGRNGEVRRARRRAHRYERRRTSPPSATSSPRGT